MEIKNVIEVLNAEVIKFGKKKNRLTTCKWLVKAVSYGRGNRT